MQLVLLQLPPLINFKKSQVVAAMVATRIRRGRGYKNNRRHRRSYAEVSHYSIEFTKVFTKNLGVFMQDKMKSKIGTESLSYQ